MAQLDLIEVECNGQIRRIELHEGDLTELPEEDAVDLLILSAFPNDYIPTRTSLIGALDRKGLSVGLLSDNKAVDLRDAFSCWLSQPLTAKTAGMRYDRILCFEPQNRGAPPALVGDIFRALAPFLGDEPPLRTAAMPIVAAGNQAYAIWEMLPPILEAALHWMSIGLPLSVLKIFAYSPANTWKAKQVFAEFKQQIAPPPEWTSEYEYDVFVSYSRANLDAARRIADTLEEHGCRYFLDLQALEQGAAWQQRIFTSIDASQKMIAVYSPQYVNSKVCQEEFNIAWARGREQNENLIFPIYWQTAKLPTYMKLLNYFDCREEAVGRLSQACENLVQELKRCE